MNLIRNNTNTNKSSIEFFFIDFVLLKSSVSSRRQTLLLSYSIQLAFWSKVLARQISQTYLAIPILSLKGYFIKHKHMLKIMFLIIFFLLKFRKTAPKMRQRIQIIFFSWYPKKTVKNLFSTRFEPNVCETTKNSIDCKKRGYKRFYLTSQYNRLAIQNNGPKWFISFITFSFAQERLIL